MRRALELLAAGLLAAAAPAAAVPPESCRPVDGLGCAYIPDGANNPPLLIYLRGWHAPYEGHVPPSACLDSARQAFTRYALGETAQAAKVAVLVTCSSDLGVTESDVAALEKATGVDFSGRILAAHSGGFVGLQRTFAAGLSFGRLLMLDNFYFAPEFSSRIQARVSGGVTCAGYYTEKTRSLYEGVFKSAVSCPVEPHDDYGHTETVVKCLAAYLTRSSCQ